ncbi:MAG: FAD-dependent oxidoreductase [Prosthecobacter sp.]
MKNIFLPAIFLPFLWSEVGSHAQTPKSRQADLCIYEATPGGIAMAVRAAREGLSVVLVNHNHHLGGILSSGLGVWDTLWEGKRSPIYDEARQAVFDHYKATYGEKSPQYRDSLPGKSGHTNGKFEPRVIEDILTKLVTQEKNITVIRGFHPAAVQREDALIKTVTFRELEGASEKKITARIFADCSYEGDLAAIAKVPYRVGREARAEFNEPHAGQIFMGAVKTPHTPEIARAAGLHGQLNIRKFSGIQKIKEPDSTGGADGNVQAFNYRTILSSDPANRLPVGKPAGYDPEKLKLLEHGSIVSPIPDNKRGWNRPQLVGMQTGYVEADWTGRKKVMDAHWDATMALLYFLQNDPSVEPVRQKSWREFGLAKNEFTDNGHRPYEFYVREARRITGRYIFTQHDAMLAPGLERAPVHEDSVGATEWYLDTHACTPRHIPAALEEGKMMLDVETFPGQVPYRSLLPQGIDNLLVPVCLSCTHVAWGTVRLEPTWMSIAESAGHAAALAIQNKVTPAELNADLLLRKLVTSHVMVSFFNDLDVSADDPRISAAQYFATKGFFAGYNARLDEPLKESTRTAWGQGLTALREGTLKPMELLKRVHQAEKEDSPPAKRTRGEALLSMWKTLTSAQPKTKEKEKTKTATAPRQPLKVEAVRSSTAQEVGGKSYDLIVVGGTPGGIACAVRAAREGLSVLLVQHNRHLGGMLTNGLMQWDALYGGPRSPIFNEYAKMIEDHYRVTYGEESVQYALARYTQTHYPMGRMEPSVAEHLFNKLVSAEKNITTLLSHHPASIERNEATLGKLTLREYGTTNDITVTAATYADATYEGDLAALARVPYSVGREGRDEHNEPHAGKIFTNISSESGPQEAKDGRLNIHPYAHVQGSIDSTSPFSADGAIQAFNHRFCLSDEPGNIRLPEKPPGYNREEYVHYNRKGMSGGRLNGKGTFNSAILPGENHAYPDATWPEREKIIQRHTNFALGLMWFLQNDESVSPAKREGYRRIGLPLDEYVDNNNLPYELYVREARRIVGRHVFTEHDNMLAKGLGRTPVHGDSIAFTDWSMDSHDCTTDRRPGYAYDGKLILTEESRPAHIPYRSLLPQGVDNLLVPVCLSATHVAWGAVRLEPVWMQVGEAAGFASALAHKHKTTPGKLNADMLVRMLVQKQHRVGFFNDLPADSSKKGGNLTAAAQYFSTKGFFADYNVKEDQPLKLATARAWAGALQEVPKKSWDATRFALEIAEAEATADRAVTIQEWTALLGGKGTAGGVDLLVTRGMALQELYEKLSLDGRGGL